MRSEERTLFNVFLLFYLPYFSFNILFSMKGQNMYVNSSTYHTHLYENYLHKKLMSVLWFLSDAWVDEIFRENLMQWFHCQTLIFSLLQYVCYMTVICLLYACYMPVICLLHCCNMHAICLLYACYMSATLLQYACYMSAICLLYVCYIAEICMLYACHLSAILLQYACQDWLLCFA